MRLAKVLRRYAIYIAGSALILSAIGVGVAYFHPSPAHAAPAAPSYMTPYSVYKELGQPQSNLGAGYLFSCQLPGGSFRCYSPRQIRNAYDIEPVIDSGDVGQGSTIVIIDAFQAPNIGGDLTVFDRSFNLPKANLHIYAPFGLTPFNPNSGNMIGWSAEITLDVEISHAIAPDAAIDLVLSTNNQNGSIYNATQWAVNNLPASVLSQSFGEKESCEGHTLQHAQNALFATAESTGTTVFASSGDSGAAQPSCNGASLTLSVSTPADSPNLTAVGGTSLNAGALGGYIGETGWSGSGGGFSTIYPTPSYQSTSGAVTGPQRGVPNVLV